MDTTSHTHTQYSLCSMLKKRCNYLKLTLRILIDVSERTCGGCDGKTKMCLLCFLYDYYSFVLQKLFKHIFELDVEHLTRCRITPASKNFVMNTRTFRMDEQEKVWCDTDKMSLWYMFSKRLFVFTVSKLLDSQWHWCGAAFVLYHWQYTIRFGKCVNASTFTYELIVIWCFPNTVASFVSS